MAVVPSLHPISPQHGRGRLPDIARRHAGRAPSAHRTGSRGSTTLSRDERTCWSLFALIASQPDGYGSRAEHCHGMSLRAGVFTKGVRMRLDGKIALVTGGTGVIGNAIAT